MNKKYFHPVRRQLLKKMALYSSGIMAGNLVIPEQLSRAAYADSHGQNSFARPFVTPTLDTGNRQGRSVHFALALNNDQSNFIGSLDTPTLGINGPFLGPVLRARQGDRVSFSVTNRLNQNATLHWHGLMLPARMDGGPHQLIRPGETWKPEFDLIQPASSYWYHAHTHRLTGTQVYHGLAGMFLVDDETSANLDLPGEYGIDDFPVVIQDRAFNRDGSLRYVTSMHDRMRGMLGNTILVNGVVTPTLTASKTLLRLRLLNGSNARIYNLGFDDGRPFTLIAGDGGFLQRAEQVTGLRLAPGERAEILLDVSDGREVVLRNLPGTGNAMPGMMGMMMGNGSESFSIMKIVPPARQEIRTTTLPDTLVTLPDWRDQPIAKQRKMQLDMLMGPRMMMGRGLGQPPFSINGQAMDMDVINFRVKKSSFEIWELSNNSMLAHPFHIHNTQFRIMAREGRPVAPEERGLKDTVLVFPGERVRLLVPFPEYTDSQRPYMYHCHILEHEDGGMMGQFTVEA